MRSSPFLWRGTCGTLEWSSSQRVAEEVALVALVALVGADPRVDKVGASAVETLVATPGKVGHVAPGHRRQK